MIESELLASVIVLAYNDKPYLEACFKSLLDQDMNTDSYEVIYADNASTDGSVDFVAEKFPSVRILRFEQNYGFAEGNNRAAEQALGKYIAFQNADTVAHRRWLLELIKAIESHPDVKACHPAGVPLNFGGYNERHAALESGVMCELTRFGYVDFTEKSLDCETVPTLFIAGGSLLIDSSIQELLGYYFDPNYFIYNEDTDLGLRINNLGFRILFVPTSQCYHQRAPHRRTSLSKKTFRMAFLVTRNRFITFYKNMHGLEFALALPLICLGSIIKLRTLPMGDLRRVVFAAGLIPYTLCALMISLVQFPKYSQKRSKIIERRAHGKTWLLKELWSRKVPPPTPLAVGLNLG